MSMQLEAQQHVGLIKYLHRCTGSVTGSRVNADGAQACEAQQRSSSMLTHEEVEEHLHTSNEYRVNHSEVWTHRFCLTLQCALHSAAISNVKMKLNFRIFQMHC